MPSRHRCMLSTRARPSSTLVGSPGGTARRCTVGRQPIPLVPTRLSQPSRLIPNTVFPGSSTLIGRDRRQIDAGGSRPSQARGSLAEARARRVRNRSAARRQSQIADSGALDGRPPLQFFERIRCRWPLVAGHRRHRPPTAALV